MTETLISSLSQLPNLTLKARSSVFRYKGKETTPQTIGEHGNVQAILNGRVSQYGNGLTLSIWNSSMCKLKMLFGANNTIGDKPTLLAYKARLRLMFRAN